MRQLGNRSFEIVFLILVLMIPVNSDVQGATVGIYFDELGTQPVLNWTGGAGELITAYVIGFAEQRVKYAGLSIQLDPELELIDHAGPPSSASFCCGANYLTLDTGGAAIIYNEELDGRGGKPILLLELTLAVKTTNFDVARIGVAGYCGCMSLVRGGRISIAGSDLRFIYCEGLDGYVVPAVIDNEAQSWGAVRALYR